MIDVLNESGTTVPGLEEHELGECVRFVLDAMHVHPQAEVTVALVDEAAIAALHERWMDLPGPTDVMSFPMDELRPGREDAPSGPGQVGDVVLCPQVAARQAETAGHPVAEEVLLLTVHGTLHLLGYDHAEPDEEREMFDLQRRLLLAFLARPGRTGGGASA
ncbi:rRNA maturation RNase YbeY [Aquipuribacter nitratireducens]|uniref:Endoribonuclease YbeY n=1 Tax=Aquipuribacter nitratireducens TaxID=650104 RepID=A0ABW0GJE4_9MICO